jgi:hypothetical protein
MPLPTHIYSTQFLGWLWDFSVSWAALLSSPVGKDPGDGYGFLPSLCSTAYYSRFYLAMAGFSIVLITP